MSDSEEDQQIISERKEKQTFLRKEILDFGFEPSAFQDFLDTIKPDGGTNIDQWTMAELEQEITTLTYLISISLNKVCIDYKTKISPSNGNGNEELLEKSGSNITEKKDSFEICDIPLTTSNELNDYFNIVKCLKRQCLVDDNEKFQIEIRNYKIQEGGLFSFTHINFYIFTHPFGCEVQRKYSDFRWLKKTLAKLYPQFITPPLPSKKSSQKIDEKSVKQRIEFLESFLNDLVKCKELRNCKIILDFLCINELTTFKSRKKQIDNLKRTQNLKDIETLDGQIQICINNDTTKLANNLGSFLLETETTYKKIKKTSKQLMIDYGHLVNTLSGLGDLFTKMNDLTSKLNEIVNPEEKFSNLDNVYITLNNIFTSWGKNVSEQIDFFEKKLCNFFKYQRMELNSFREILKTKQSYENEYRNYSNKLKLKKEKYFASYDPSKWEIDPVKLTNLYDKKEFFNNIKKNKEDAFKFMFHKESNIENEFKDEFGFINFNFFEETKRFLLEKLKRYCDHFINFSVVQSEFLSNMHLLWADANTILALNIGHNTKSRLGKTINHSVSLKT